MSIASDIRTYADNAVTQGKHVLDQAQAQLNDVTGRADEFYGKTRENVAEIAGKATIAVNDLRAQAEKAVNFDAIKTAVEPYVAQVKGYTHQVTDRAEVLLETVKTDARVAKLVDAAEVVIDTVQVRVVKPVQTLTTRGAATAPVAEPALTTVAAPTAAAAATAKPAAPKAAATKPAATKPATKPAARKAPVKRIPND